MGSHAHLEFLLLLLVSWFLLSSTNVGVQSCMEEEREALLNFKTHLIDQSRRLSWVGPQCCEWRGISCNNYTGHVVKLDLRNPNPSSMGFAKYIQSCLGGKLHASLLGLKHLSYLDLSQNCFDESYIPSFISDLTSLRYLNLSYSWSSSLAREIPPSLGNLSKLSYLDIGVNRVGAYSNNLNWLSHVPSLKYLNLGGVNLSQTGVTWLHSVNMLPSLLELHLPNCEIGENQLPHSLRFINFTSLLVLDMSDNHISSKFPKLLFNLTSLTNLDLGGNAFVHPSFDEFVRLKSLEHLNLKYAGISGRLLPFGNLCKMKSLDFSRNKFEGGIEEFLSPFTNCSLNRLESLTFYGCGLTGKLPSSLGLLKSLQFLNLGNNSFRGSIPESIFRNLSSSPLSTLSLGRNFLTSIPQSLGQLNQLAYLYLTENAWEGSLTEAHFINLTSLKYLSLTTTQHLFFNLTDHEWIPPFQLNVIIMYNCILGTGFPLWLQSQTELTGVSLVNGSISGTIPVKWMSSISAQLQTLDLSDNQISGMLLPFQLDFPNLISISLSYNKFYGTIPSSICTSMPSLAYLSFNNNQLSGEFPEEWSMWGSIFFIDVSNNNLSGSIPTSMGVPSSLVVLKANNNQLRGEIPSALRFCASLDRLHLRGNKFTGKIPSWIGLEVSRLTAVQLGSNLLSGNLTNGLCNLQSLQVLDLSRNRFSGTIPNCLDNLTALISSLHYWSSSFRRDSDGTTVTTKGRDNEYFFRGASLLGVIDLSSNDLEGEIPEEISSLVQLNTLNLSMNQLSGDIPSKIGNLNWLETLDLSQNKLSGNIPQTLSNLTFLSHLNLSHNTLTGRIPTGSQLQTLNDASIYEGNPSLCGFPLSKCEEDKDNKPEPRVDENEDDGNAHEKLEFYTSVVLGFIIGFWSVCGTLILKKSWRYAYFRFFDNIKEKVALQVALGVARLQRR